MAQCELLPGIKSISGRVGNFIFKTRHYPNGETKTFVHLAPPKRRPKRK